MAAKSGRQAYSLPEQILNSVLVFIRKHPRKVLAPIVAIGTCLIIWQILCNDPKSPLPGPLTVIDQTWELIINPFYDGGGTDKGLGWQILASLQRVAVGYSLSALVGIIIGTIIGSNRLLYEAFDPIFQLLRTVPPLAWLPIALAVFKDSNPAGLFVIFITAIWPIIYNTAVGVQQVPQDYKNVARVLQLSRSEYFIQILIPSTVPFVFTGLRIGIGLAWLAIVAAEMLRGDTGIGFFIWNSYNSSNNSEVILALIYIGVVGLLLDKFVGYISTLISSAEQK